MFVEIGPLGYSCVKTVDIVGSNATLRIDYSARRNQYRSFGFLWTINFMINKRGGGWKHFWSADLYSAERNGHTVPFRLFVYELAYPMHQCLMSKKYFSYRFDGRVDKWTKRETALWKEVFGISDAEWQTFLDNVSKYREM